MLMEPGVEKRTCNHSAGEANTGRSHGHGQCLHRQILPKTVTKEIDQHQIQHCSPNPKTSGVWADEMVSPLKVLSLPPRLTTYVWSGDPHNGRKDLTLGSISIRVKSNNKNHEWVYRGGGEFHCYSLTWRTEGLLKPYTPKQEGCRVSHWRKIAKPQKPNPVEARRIISGLTFSLLCSLAGKSRELSWTRNQRGKEVIRAARKGQLMGHGVQRKRKCTRGATWQLSGTLVTWHSSRLLCSRNTSTHEP